MGQVGRWAHYRSEEGRSAKAGTSGREGGLGVGRLADVVAGREAVVEGASKRDGSLLFRTRQQLVFLFVLTGREKEIDLFVSCLKAYKALGQRHILAFEGPRGSGKSHLLAELAYLGQAAGHRYRFLTCSFGTLPLPIPWQPWNTPAPLPVRLALGLQPSEKASWRHSLGAPACSAPVSASLGSWRWLPEPWPFLLHLWAGHR